MSNLDHFSLGVNFVKLFDNFLSIYARRVIINCQEMDLTESLERSENVKFCYFAIFFQFSQNGLITFLAPPAGRQQSFSVPIRPSSSVGVNFSLKLLIYKKTA